MSVRLRLLTYFGLLSAAGATTFVVLWLYGVPMLGIEGIQTAESRRSIASVEALVDKERDVFAQWFVERRRELHLLVASENFSATVASAVGRKSGAGQQARALLERHLQTIKESNSGVYNYLYLVDPVSGKMIATTEPQWQLAPAEHSEILHESTQPGLTEFVYLFATPQGREVVLTNQVQGFDVDGSPTGALHAVLVAGVDLSAPLRGEDEAVRQYLGVTGALMLADRSGNILVSSTVDKGSVVSNNLDYLREALEPGSEGVKMLTSADGHEVQMAFRHLHLGASDGLSLLAIRGSDDALKSLRATFQRLITVGVAIFILAMGLVRFAAKRIATTEEQVHSLNAHLEARVQQRTLELEQANSELTSTLERLERTRSELLESEKLSSLGSLVAGVAHELNTPIGNALMAASTLSDEARALSERVKTGMTRSAFEQHLQNTTTGTAMLMDNISRAAELISGFKQLAVDQTTDQRRMFALNDALIDIQVALGPTLRKIPFVLQVTPSPEKIQMDSYPGPLSRTIINLINNAILHGFEGRQSGVMQIVTRLADAQHAEIVFSDDGVGMTDEVRKRVFEPFFTTKLGQGGSGLGMHLVYNNVTKILGGRIELESAPGKGTRYRLLLPLVAP